MPAYPVGVPRIVVPAPGSSSFNSSWPPSERTVCAVSQPFRSSSFRIRISAMSPMAIRFLSWLLGGFDSGSPAAA